MYNKGARTSTLTGLPGWETEAEEILLFTYAALVPAGGRILEIGAEFGMSTGAFCAGAQFGVQIISVDLFPGELVKHHRANLAEAGYEHRTTQLIGDSHTLEWETTAWLFQPIDEEWIPDVNGPHMGIDLLFIDGDHSYEGVLADCRNWTRYVKPGGYCIFHDVAQDTNKEIQPIHEDVAAAILTWVDRQTPGAWVLGEMVDSIRVYRRAGLDRELDE